MFPGGKVEGQSHPSMRMLCADVQPGTGYSQAISVGKQLFLLLGGPRFYGALDLGFLEYGVSEGKSTCGRSFLLRLALASQFGTTSQWVLVGSSLRG